MDIDSYGYTYAFDRDGAGVNANLNVNVNTSLDLDAGLDLDIDIGARTEEIGGHNHDLDLDLDPDFDVGHKRTDTKRDTTTIESEPTPTPPPPPAPQQQSTEHTGAGAQVPLPSDILSQLHAFLGQTGQARTGQSGPQSGAGNQAGVTGNGGSATSANGVAEQQNSSNSSTGDPYTTHSHSHNQQFHQHQHPANNNNNKKNTAPQPQQHTLHQQWTTVNPYDVRAQQHYSEHTLQHQHSHPHSRTESPTLTPHERYLQALYDEELHHPRPQHVHTRLLATSVPPSGWPAIPAERLPSRASRAKNRKTKNSKVNGGGRHSPAHNPGGVRESARSTPGVTQSKLTVTALGTALAPSASAPGLSTSVQVGQTSSITSANHPVSFSSNTLWPAYLDSRLAAVRNAANGPAHQGFTPNSDSREASRLGLRRTPSPELKAHTTKAMGPSGSQAGGAGTEPTLDPDLLHFAAMQGYAAGVGTGVGSGVGASNGMYDPRNGQVQPGRRWDNADEVRPHLHEDGSGPSRPASQFPSRRASVADLAHQQPASMMPQQHYQQQRQEPFSVAVQNPYPAHLSRTHVSGFTTTSASSTPRQLQQPQPQPQPQLQQQPQLQSQTALRLNTYPFLNQLSTPRVPVPTFHIPIQSENGTTKYYGVTVPVDGRLALPLGLTPAQTQAFIHQVQLANAEHVRSMQVAQAQAAAQMQLRSVIPGLAQMQWLNSSNAPSGHGQNQGVPPQQKYANAANGPNTQESSARFKAIQQAQQAALGVAHQVSGSAPTSSAFAGIPISALGAAPSPSTASTPSTPLPQLNARQPKENGEQQHNGEREEHHHESDGQERNGHLRVGSTAPLTAPTPDVHGPPSPVGCSPACSKSHTESHGRAASAPSSPDEREPEEAEPKKTEQSHTSRPSPTPPLTSIFDSRDTFLASAPPLLVTLGNNSFNLGPRGVPSSRGLSDYGYACDAVMETDIRGSGVRAMHVSILVRFPVEEEAHPPEGDAQHSHVMDVDSSNEEDDEDEKEKEREKEREKKEDREREREREVAAAKEKEPSPSPEEPSPSPVPAPVPSPLPPPPQATPKGKKRAPPKPKILPPPLPDEEEKMDIDSEPEEPVKKKKRVSRSKKKPEVNGAAGPSSTASTPILPPPPLPPVPGSASGSTQRATPVPKAPARRKTAEKRSRRTESRASERSL